MRPRTPASLRAPRTGESRERGFSIIELLVAMVIAVEILVASLYVFDVHNRMSRIQMQITEAQQAVRVAQYDIGRIVRMAGRGGLPATFTQVATGSTSWLASPAIEVRNNLTADDDREVARGFGGTPSVIPGTDLLVVRGCISGLLFQLDPSSPTDFNADPDTPGTIDTGTLIIRRITVAGREQNLQELLEPGFSSPVLLQSATNRGQYAIAEVNAVAGDLDAVTLTLDFLPNDDTPNNPLVGLPDPAMAVGFACVLEEYRYYVRELAAVADGDVDTPRAPRLSRARMIPGTETPYQSLAANLTLDLANDIFDLQIALGFDTDYDLDGGPPGSFDDDVDQDGNDDVLYEGADDGARATDDWLWNSSSDDPAEVQYRVNAGVLARPVHLYYARITTVGRTAQLDPRYTSPDFDTIANEDWVEDHDYDTAPATDWKSGVNSRHRRRILQTTIDLRNI